MRIGILGTGMMAAALGGRWAAAGHDIAVAGRSPDKVRALAGELGRGVRAATVREAVDGADAVLLAVAFDGVDEILRVAESAGTLFGTTLIDPTNAVEHGIGLHRLPTGTSAAQHIAGLAPDAHVVKAFHMFPAAHWSEPAAVRATVPLCGDDPDALRVTATLIRDAGADPAVLGGLDRARQLEEAAGFVIGLVFGGFDPRAAVPHLPVPAPAA
ncbi:MULTISPECIES: NADPH-dependent F420 reductase [Nocardia]|uniref:NADPH-dependent F420 reductase n=1 Tax=Nocardia TaxID=1817 RepID=UPI000D68E664|nr:MULTISPECIES: NAD(P)-binding domain-containing protein [Nocardia]